MDEETRKKLRQVLEIFEFAAEEERKAQDLYQRNKKECSNYPDLAALFDWLHGQEVDHEKALLQKYTALKAKLTAN